MKRVNIMYGGAQYSVGEADVEAIKAAIEQAHERGLADWITVNFGEGRPQPAQLLVGPGIPVSIVPIPADDPLPGEEEDDGSGESISSGQGDQGAIRSEELPG